MANKHWEMKDGKMVRKPHAQRYPAVERSNDHSINGLTLLSTATRSMTFTLEQLQRAVTVDKLVCTAFTREQALDLFSSLVRENRYELFGTYDGYRIITNGYGQLKEVKFSHSNPLSAKDIFIMLERVLDL